MHPLGEPAAPPKILVVDDEEVIRQLCVHALSAYQVCEATDGTEALALLEHNRFDLILTDVMMPEMGGLELLRTIRERAPNQVVVIMTGYADKEIILQAKNSH